MTNFDDDDVLARVTMMLADSAQVADGKLFVLGGGLVAINPGQPFGLATLMEIGPGLSSGLHQWTIELLDDDGGPVMAGDMPVMVGGEFDLERPPDAEHTLPMILPLALGITALPVAAGSFYTWRLAIDGTSEPEWSLRFFSRREEPPPAS